MACTLGMGAGWAVSYRLAKWPSAAWLGGGHLLAGTRVRGTGEAHPARVSRVSFTLDRFFEKIFDRM